MPLKKAEGKSGFLSTRSSRQERITSLQAEEPQKIFNASTPNSSPKITPTEPSPSSSSVSKPSTITSPNSKPSSSPKITPNISLKLLIYKNKERVLFAEAKKEFVDFLFSLMSLPLGHITSLLSRNEMVGSFGKLHESFDNLSDLYTQPRINKQALLEPKITVPDIETDPIHVCVSCGCTVSSVVPFVPDQNSCGGNYQRGYVKDVFTYVVMDDLEVKPMDDVSSVVALLNKFNIKEIHGVYEKKVVSLGKAEGLKLLKPSLESKTVLTDVFFKKGKAS